MLNLIVNRNLCLLLCVCFLIQTKSNHLQAQEQLGLRNENFSGVNGIFLNPTSHSTMPLQWDLNIVGGSFHFENDYAFIRQTSLLDLAVSRDASFKQIVHLDESNNTNNTFVIDYNDDSQRRYVNVLGKIEGPAAIIKLGHHTVGAFYNFRFSGNVFGIPKNLSYLLFYYRPYEDKFHTTKFKSGTLLWDEVGLNYAHKKETGPGFISIGANIKYLRGYEGAYFNLNQDLIVQKERTDSLSSNFSDINYGVTTSSLDQESFARKINGQGIGIDLGITATFGHFKDEGYKLKLGFSILDLGYIHFVENAQRHELITEEAVITTTSPEVDEISDYNNYFQSTSQDILGDSRTSLKGNDFSIWTPSAFSIQADYSVIDRVFVNATLVQRLRVGKNITSRSNILSISPRYEHRWFSLQMPLILSNYRDLRMGLSARLGFLVFGTDDIGGFINSNSDFDSADAYIALKFNPFSLSNNNGVKGRRSSGKGNKTKCYNF